MPERNFAFKLSLGTQPFVTGLQSMAKKMQSTFAASGAQIKKTLGESVPTLQADPKKLLNYSVGGVNVEKSKLSEKKTGKLLALPEGFQTSEKEQAVLDELKAKIAEINKTRINPETKLEGIYSFQDSIDKAKIDLKELKDYLSEMRPNVDFSEFGVQLDDILGDTKAKAAEMETHLQKALPFTSLERFKANFKRSLGGLRDGFGNFKKEFAASKTIEGMAGAFSRFGAVGIKSLTSLLGPYAAVMAATGAAVMAVKKLCKEYEKQEQAQLKMSRAFRMGGRMKGASLEKFQGMAGDLASDGMYRAQDVTQGMASARQNAPSLSSEQFEKASKLAKDAAAVLGTDYAPALERVTGLLDAETVSYKELSDAGVILDFNDAKHLETLQGYYKAEERRKFILEKMGDAYRDAAKEQAGSLSGMYRQFENTFGDIKAKIGEILAPVMKLVMGIVNPIMQVFKAILAPVKALLRPIGQVFGMVTSIFHGFSESLSKPLQRFSKVWESVASSMDKNPIFKGLVEGFKLLGKVVGWVLGRILDGITLVIRAVSAIPKLFEALWKALKPTGFTKPFENLCKSIKKVGVYLSNAIAKFKEWKDAAKEWAAEKAGKITDGIKKYTGIDLKAAKRYLTGEEEEAEQKKKEESYIDPRQKFNIQFEDAGAMNRRIQTSLLEKNSPAVRQVELLTRIYEAVQSGGSERKKESREQVGELREVQKAARENKAGFAL